jgi:hypothetical protein
VTRRKYATQEEAAAAKREQAKLRRAIIQQLVDQHNMELRARAVEAAARARLAPAKPTTPTHTPTQQEIWRRMLSHTSTRSFMIRMLLDNYYDELKAELDAYRLLKSL